MEVDKIFWTHGKNQATSGDSPSDYSDLEYEDEDMEDNLVHWATWRKEQGNNLFRQGDFHTAISIYKEVLDFVIKDIPTDPIEYMSVHNLITSCYLNMAACQLKLGDFHEALLLCNQVLCLDGKNVKGFFRRAQAYRNLGSLDCAKADLEKALDIDHNNKEVKCALFDVCDEIKRSFNARKAKMKGLMPMDVELEQGSTSSFCPSSHVSTLECACSNLEVSRKNIGKTNQDSVKDDVNLFSDGSNKECEASDCESQVTGKCIDKQASSPLLRFWDKKKRQSRWLSLERRVYNKIMNGRKLTFFNSHSLSCMTIRVVEEGSNFSGADLSEVTEIRSDSHSIDLGDNSNLEPNPTCLDEEPGIVNESLPMSKKLNGEIHKIAVAPQESDHVQSDIGETTSISFEGDSEEEKRPSFNLQPQEGCFVFSARAKKRHRRNGASSISHSQLECAYDIEGNNNKVHPFKCSYNISCRNTQEKHEARPRIITKRNNTKGEHTSSIGHKRKQSCSNTRKEQALPRKRVMSGGFHLRGVASEQVFRYFGNTDFIRDVEIDEIARYDRWCAADSSTSHTQSVQESGLGCSQAYSDEMESSAICC